MKKTTLLQPAFVACMLLCFSCSSNDNRSNNTSTGAEVVKDSVSNRDIQKFPTNADKYNEAVASATAIKDSIDVVITNMRISINYDSLRAEGRLNLFNISINEMLLAKNRIDLDLDRLLISDLTKSVNKLNTVTAQMGAKKDELNQFTQRIEKIANCIKTLVDITTFLAGNGYLKSLPANPAPNQ